MKREDILKILEEADNVLGNFTDGQQRSHLSIKENSKKFSKEKRKEVAINNGNKLYKDKKGLFKFTKEERIEIAKKGNSSLTKEQKSKGGKIGGKLRLDKGKTVLMIDKTTNEILMEFPAISTAARFLEKRENKIRDVISNRRKSAYGFIWKIK